MKPFAYASPRALEDAVALLTGDAHASFLAGGTDLLTLLKADLLEPSQLVDIKRLAELDDAITRRGDTLRIGALATLSDLETHPLVAGQGAGHFCIGCAPAAVIAARERAQEDGFHDAHGATQVVKYFRYCGHKF